MTDPLVHALVTLLAVVPIAFGGLWVAGFFAKPDAAAPHPPAAE